jgi:hypothetical protein
VSCRPLLPIQSLSQFLEISNGKRKGRVPWTHLQKARVDYIKPKYLPKQVTLKQYYHLTQKDVSAILKHWTWRQAAGKVPFCFRKVAKAVRENVDALEENNADANSDMGPGEEAEGDSQGDAVSQAWGDGASRGDGGGNGSTDQAFPAQSTGNAAENAQGAVQPSKAADAYAPQQTGGDAPDSPHTSHPGTHSRPQPLNYSLAGGSQLGQTDGAPTEDRQSESTSAGREPSFNDEVSNLDHHIGH